jgi:tetratricopeptide (TPR) repeat protein
MVSSTMGDSTQEPARRRIRNKILLGLYCLGIAAWFAWLALNMSARNSLDRYEHQWEAKGEHFALSDFVPKPVPDNQNFALTPIVATMYESYLGKNGLIINSSSEDGHNEFRRRMYNPLQDSTYSTNLGDWAKDEATDLRALQFYYRTVLAKTNGFPTAPQAQAPAADVLLALSKYDQTIEELRQAAALPDSRFPLNYTDDLPAEILLPHLSMLKQGCQVLELRAVVELQNGQSDKALADVKLMVRLMDSIRTEPFLISHLVRIGMCHMVLQPVWEGIQEHHWSDTQLAELNQELAVLDFLADYEFSMRGERALEMANIEYMRRTRKLDAFSGVNDDDEDNALAGVTRMVYHLIPNSVFYQNELVVARGIQDWFLPIVNVQQHRVLPETEELAETNLEQLHAHWFPNNIFAVMTLPTLEASCRRYAYAQSSVDMARVACALERYRLAQSQYPETLAALSPRFIEALPADVIGGRPLKYHRTADGQFVLYSVGWNGADDGGTVFWINKSKLNIDLKRGDWVWRGQIMKLPEY